MGGHTSASSRARGSTGSGSTSCARPRAARSVAIIQALLAGDELGVAGERFTLAPGTTLAYPRFRETVPLLVGTWGERRPRGQARSQTSSRSAEANPDLVPVVREWIGNPRVKIVLGCVSVVDEDAAWARERARSAVAPYLDVVAGLDPTIDPTAPPPLDRFCIAGTPEEVAARVEALWNAGADQVELGTPQGRNTLAGIELICDQMPPLLRA